MAVGMGGFEGFSIRDVDVDGLSLHMRCGGDGPPLLLLHGFPETHCMWRDVAPGLAERFAVVCVDLPGYGRSGCPADGPDHAPHSKRATAGRLAGLMTVLGHPRFSVVGHDRGGRVAYRLALDHADRVAALAVLDVLPTATAWERADDRFALAYWPWSFLAQPAPLPELLLERAPEAVVADAAAGWGSSADAFPADVRAAYIDALRDPAHAHAVCEEYRAAAGIDREHDAADRAAGRRIACPLQVLWGADGPLDTWYAAAGGPLALWREWASGRVDGAALDGGHFFPEAQPAATADALERFLLQAQAS